MSVRDKDYTAKLNAELLRLGISLVAKVVQQCGNEFLLTDWCILCFLRRVDPTGPHGCWLWRGYKTREGYGKYGFKIPGIITPPGERPRNVTISAHRFAYQILKGPIPDGLTIDHRCFVRHCVNPRHLDACTMDANLKRSPNCVTTVNRNKTACPKGHSYDTHARVDGSVRRICGTCETERRSRDRDALLLGRAML